MASLTLPSELIDALSKEGGRIVLACHDQTNGTREWLCGVEWGREEPDNPDNDMVGAAAYGVDVDLHQAVAQALGEMGIEV
jgi:hypothetical protein